MSSAGRSDVRQANDFYRTPSWVTEAILPHLPSGGDVCDAGCGDGAILAAIAATAPFVHSQLHGVEIDPALAAQAAMHLAEPRRHHIYEGDFLRHGLNYDLVVCNPPFSFAREFVEHALALVASRRGTVAMLLRLAWMAGQARASFHTEHPSDVYVLSRRPSFTGGGTDSADYAWFVWGPGRGGRWSVLGGTR